MALGKGGRGEGKDPGMAWRVFFGVGLVLIIFLGSQAEQHTIGSAIVSRLFFDQDMSGVDGHGLSSLSVY